METKKYDELGLIAAKGLLATVEVDTEAGEAGGISGYVGVLEKSLAAAAEQRSNLIASVYIRELESVNFGEPTYSAFIGVAGSAELHKAIQMAMEKAFGRRARSSDSVKFSGSPKYHVEGRRMWEIMDALTYFTHSPKRNNK